MTAELSRRGLLLGALAAPAIVRASSLMVVKAIRPLATIRPGPAGAILVHNGSKPIWVNLSNAARYVRLDLTPAGTIATSFAELPK